MSHLNADNGGIEVYAIGKSDYNFIKIANTATMYDGQKMRSEIISIEYKVPLNEATIISDYEKAERLIEEIQGNVENIKFANNSIIGEILDREKSFDKIAYSKELQIYELIPIAVER